jgi:nucleoid DNA-binding protein
LSKLDIINEVANKTGITKTKAGIAVETVLESLKRALAHGEHVELRGLSVHNVRPRRVRAGSTLPAMPKLPYKSNLNQEKLRRAVAEVAAEESRRAN